MANINKLKGILKERGINVNTLAEMTGYSKDRLYRRLKNDGAGFTLEEISKIKEALDLTADETHLIFFAE